MSLYSINIFILIIFLFFYIKIEFETLLNPESAKIYSFKTLFNDYCQNNLSNLSEIEKYSCNNSYKKSNFIWLSIDGLANNMLNNITNLNKSGFPNFFMPEIHEIHRAGPSFESQLTGSRSMNLNYNKIDKDNILNQMKRIYMNIEYEGLEIPFGFYFDDSDVFFTTKYFSTDEKFPFLKFCDIDLNLDSEIIFKYLNTVINNDGTLKKGISKNEVFINLSKFYNMNELYEKFENCIKKRDFFLDFHSILYYSNIIDYTNHKYFKYHYKQYLNTFALEIYILLFKKWIDNNDNYALIINSDHGGQEFPYEENYVPHGNYFLEKNYPSFLIYTKEFGENFNKFFLGKKTINFYNIVPTISQIITNINIPLESIGIPEFLGDDEIIRISAIKSKENQLKQIIEKYEKKFKNFNFFFDIKKELYNSKYLKFKSIENFTISNSNNYMNFLENIQTKINQKLKNKTNFIKKFPIVFFLIIKTLFDLYFYFTTKIEINLIKIKKRKYLILLFISNFDNLIFFYYYFNNIYDNYRISKFLSFLFLLIIILIHLFKSKFNKISKQFTLFYISLLILIFSGILFYYELFNKLQILYFKIKKFKFLYLIFIYLFSFFFIHTQISKFKILYTIKNVNLYIFFFIFNFIIHILLFSFNVQNLYYQKQPNKFFKKIIWIFYVIIFFGFLFSLFPFKLRIIKNDNNKYFTLIITNKKKRNYFILFNYFYYFLFIFISNDNEVTFFVFLIIPYLEFISNVFRSTKKNQYFLILLILLLINFCDLIYFVNYKIYSLETTLINLDNKLLGFIKNNNFLKKIFHHIYLYKYNILSAFYILSLLKISKLNKFTKNTYIIISVLIIKFDFFFLVYLKILYSLGLEGEFIYDLLLIFYGKCLEFFIVFIIILISRFINYIRLFFEKFRKKRNNNLIEEQSLNNNINENDLSNIN